MSFDERQAQRHKLLERVMLAAQAVGVLYLAAHAGIVWLAYGEDGVAAALLSLVLLGFGDLYWGLRWAMQEGRGALAGVALGAAAVCFASWALRPRFNAWAMRLTGEMLGDLGEEIACLRGDEERCRAADEAEAVEDVDGSMEDRQRRGEERGGS